MKIKIITLLTILLASVVVYAITEQWSMPAGAYVYQTVADGSGGCAVYFVQTNSIGKVVWLDKKGQEKYSKTMIVGAPAPIASCTKKMLIYNMFPTSSLPYIVTVDSKGIETAIKKDHEVVYPGSLPGIGGVQILSDKKGFFVQSVKTNTPGATLYRYSNK
jgi:hypothetical protein